ncbi:MAG: glycosyltransferase family 2 protein [Bacteriovorax sp.]|nr:glycosyltransferase family 2 protein [Bacteriovorax sp.]
MQIDVIVPTFNRAPVVSKAIESVLKQTYKNFNLYVVDDGSTDNTTEVLEIYKSHSNVHILKQKNFGVSAARNFAVNNSSAPWISFLDSDDEWLPNKLELQIAWLKNNPSIRFLHGEEIWMRNGVRVNPKAKHAKSNENIFERSLDFCLISPSTVMMRRDLFVECGMFDESFIVCEDYDLWLKILIKENIGFTNEKLTIKNGGHDDQLSTKFVAMDYWRIKSLVQLYKNQSNDLSAEKKEQIKNVLLKKSEILLPAYLKHHNHKVYNEVFSMLTSIQLFSAGSQSRS